MITADCLKPLTQKHCGPPDFNYRPRPTDRFPTDQLTTKPTDRFHSPSNRARLPTDRLLPFACIHQPTGKNHATSELITDRLKTILERTNRPSDQPKMSNLYRPAGRTSHQHTGTSTIDRFLFFLPTDRSIMTSLHRRPAIYQEIKLDTKILIDYFITWQYTAP